MKMRKKTWERKEIVTLGVWFFGDTGAIPPRLGLLQEVHSHRCHSGVGQKRRCERSRCKDAGLSFHLPA